MKVQNILISMALVIMIGACSSDDTLPLTEQSLQPILFSTSLQTRAGQNIQNTMFEKGQEINVQITAKDNKTKYDLLTYFVSDNNGTVAPKTGVYPYYPTNKAKVNVRAIYPKGYMSATEFIVRNPQTAKADYMASDLMFASLSDLDTPETETTQTLDFKHKMVKIQVNLTAEGGVELQNSRVKLLNVKTQTDFNATTGEVSEEGKGSVSDMIISNNGKVGCAAIIVPQTVESGYLIEIVLANNDILNYRTAQTTTFESGKKYTYNIKVIESDIAVSTSVSDWEYDPDTDVSERVKL